MKPLLVDAMAATAIAACALLALGGCQWARVRYVEGSERSVELHCEVRVNDLVCRDYFKALAQDGVQLVPAWPSPRGVRGEEL